MTLQQRIDAAGIRDIKLSVAQPCSASPADFQASAERLLTDYLDGKCVPVASFADEVLPGARGSL